MLGPLGHLGSLVAYLATARRQHASDETCARQLAWSGSLPRGLALAPARIVPTHYDDFFRPLDAPPRFSLNVNLTGFADEVHRASRDLPIATLAVGARVGGPDAGT